MSCFLLWPILAKIASWFAGTLGVGAIAGAAIGEYERKHGPLFPSKEKRQGPRSDGGTQVESKAVQSRNPYVIDLRAQVSSVIPPPPPSYTFGVQSSGDTPHKKSVALSRNKRRARRGSREETCPVCDGKMVRVAGGKLTCLSCESKMQRIPTFA